MGSCVGYWKASRMEVLEKSNMESAKMSFYRVGLIILKLAISSKASENQKVRSFSTGTKKDIGNKLKNIPQ